MALKVSFGNGFLDRLEHRRLVKLNGGQVFQKSDHKITLFGIGYDGFSYVAGLSPIHGFNSVDAANGWSSMRVASIPDRRTRHIRPSSR